jgi:hypoxanthine phosphoribosyltransferase
MNAKMKKLFNEAQIKETVAWLGAAISADFRDRDLVVVCVLKGSFMFTSDLIREIKNDNLLVDFIRAASYGEKTETCGTVTLTKDLEIDIVGKDVIIVEDIIDSGLTLSCIRDALLERNPRSVRICALVDKRARRKVALEGDYVGFTIEDGFIVGYGIDYAEKYRNLREIFVVGDT